MPYSFQPSFWKFKNIGLIIFYYTPYSYYLEPSFYKFKEICQLDPEIYQANGGKLDEEYYNKILGYYNLNLDTLDYNKFQETAPSDFIQRRPPYKKTKLDDGQYLYFSLGYLYDDNLSNRISLVVKIIFNNDKPKNKQDIDKIYVSDVEWKTYRPYTMYWDFYYGKLGMPAKTLDCDYFKENKDK